jgi:hypothetical protein
MSKRRSAGHVQKGLSRPHTNITTAPATPPPDAAPPRRTWWWLLPLGGLAVAAGVAFFFLGRLGLSSEPEPAKPSAPPVDAAVKEFARLKNAHDPAANDLLAPEPEVPAEPVSEAEKERLDANFILRRPFEVSAIRVLADGATGVRRYVLVIEGGVASQPMSWHTAAGKVEKGQRLLNNPDVVVEVRDGKIHGVRAGLHDEFPTRPVRDRGF